MCCGLWIPICRLSFPCFGLWIAATIHCVFVAAEGTWFGLQLSCFGHVRAKNNSELPCGLELCFLFCLGLSPVVFAFIREP